MRNGLVLGMLAWAACANDPSTSTRAEELTHATPVPPGIQQAVVEVFSHGNQCTGTLITNDTVLTASHCFCSDGVCDPHATTFFRDWTTGAIDPAFIEGATFARVPVDEVSEVDIGIVKLDHPAPPPIRPLPTARVNPPDETPQIILGYGWRGGGCDQQWGSLNYVYNTFWGTTLWMATSDHEVCSGDSGGPWLVRATGGVYTSDQVFAVTSGEIEIEDFGATTAHNNTWLKSFICKSSLQNKCHGNADPCFCTAETQILWENANRVLAVWELDGGRFDDQYPGTLDGTFQIAGSGDFDGDHHQDVLLRDNSGQVRIWHLNGNGTFLGSNNVGPADPTHMWSVQAVADFDGDGVSDILWRATNGQLAIWRSGDSSTALYPSYRNTGAPADISWRVLGAGDFNGDGKADILWQGGTTVAIWLMNGGTFVKDIYPPPTTSTFQGIGDLNGDGKADIVWRYTYGSNIGMMSVYFGGMTRAAGPSYQNATTNGQPSPVGLSFELIGISDIDHDGRADMIWRDAGHDGYISFWLMDGLRFIGSDGIRGRSDINPRHVDPSWTSYGVLHEREF